MRRVNIFQFYRFGITIKLLHEVDQERSMLDQYSDLMDADAALADLLGQEQVSLKPIATAILELRAQIAHIANRIVHEEFKADEKIKPGSFLRLKTCLRKFETVFEAEVAERVNVYSVSVKGIYNTSLLIEHADHAIPDDLRGILPESAKYDLKQSGRCLAFEIPTAVGFHALRAAETVIKAYYKKLTGNEWDAVNRPSQRNWGQYIDGLKGAGAKTGITTSLEHIRDHYRNPIIHPEVVLSLNESLGLFSLTLSVISLMLEEIQP